MTLEDRLERIERLITLNGKEVFNTSEAAMYLGVSEGRVRHLTSKREIPFYKHGNKTFFKKSEIEEWQLEFRVPSIQETNIKASSYIVSK